MAKAVVARWSGLYLTPGPLGSEILNITVYYVVSTLSGNESRAVQFQATSVDTIATIKANAAAAIVADASVGGYSLLAADILFQDGAIV